MKIVVIGGTGLIGSKLVRLLAARGHKAVAASPQSGVDTITGEGLTEALTGADVVVDVANSPSFADDDVLHFFQTAGRNLVAAEQATGVRHHVALSVVGADRLPDSGYLRAKVAQEELIKAGGVPFTILRATQFFEFLSAIAGAAAEEGDVVRLSTGLMQPVAADDVAATLAELAEQSATGETVELAGPEAAPMSAFVRRFLDATDDKRKVVEDPQARYFGAVLDDKSITPGDSPRIGAMTFPEWLSRPQAAR